MAKIDLESAPKAGGTRYPPPHDAPVKNRRWVRVGDAAGLTQFGVNLTVLNYLLPDKGVIRLHKTFARLP